MEEEEEEEEEDIARRTRPSATAVGRAQLASDENIF